MFPELKERKFDLQRLFGRDATMLLITTHETAVFRRVRKIARSDY